MKKNILGSLKLIAMALVVASAYWLSYGMSDVGYRVSHSAEQARAQAEQKAKTEGKTSAEIKEAGRQAAIQTTKDVQAQLEQEYVARGRRPSVSRAQVATKPVAPEIPAAQPAAPKTESLVSWLPVDLSGERKFAVLIIDEQFDFMQIPFKENALGKELSGGKEDFDVGRLAVGGANQQFLEAQLRFLEACWKMGLARIFSQDWHKPGSVSFASSYQKKQDGTQPNPFVPLGENAGNYKAVGAVGSCEGVENLSADAEKRKGQVAIIEEQVLWPDHCMQGTKGAEMPDMLFADGSYETVKNAQPSVAPQLGVAPQGYQSSKGLEFIVEKGVYCHVDSYSALLDNDRKTKTELESILVALGITDVIIKGIATDYCVGSSVEHIIESGRNAHWPANLSRGVARDTMVKRLQRVADLKGPNGAHAYFYHITDLNDGGETKKLLKDAGLWDTRTIKLTLAEFMDFVKSLHGKKGGIEELLPELQPIEPTELMKTVEAVKPAVSRPALTSIEPKVLTETPTEEGYESGGEEGEPSFGWSQEEEEETPAPVVPTTPAATGRAAALAKNYEAQKTKDAPRTLIDFAKSTRDEAGNYVELSYGLKKQVFMKQADGGYKIEFKNWQWELDSDGNSKSAGKPLAPAAPVSSSSSSSSASSSAPFVKPAPTLSERYEKQKAQYASAWKSVGFQQSLDLDKLTEEVDKGSTYGSIGVPVSGPAPFVYKKTRSDSGDQWMIEFKDREYTYAAVDGVFKSERLLGAGMPEPLPTAPIVPQAAGGTGVSAATLANRYDEQKTRPMAKAPDLVAATINARAGDYISTSVPKGPTRYYQILPNGGYKIEFKDNTYEYNSDKKLVMPTSKPAGVRTPTSMAELLAIDPLASMPTPPTSSGASSAVESF